MIESSGLEEVHSSLGGSSEASWTALYGISEEDQTSEAQQLIQRYSEYKYGSPEATQYFAQLLVTEVRKRHGDSLHREAGEWVVVSPPHRAIASPSSKLGKAVADRLGIPHVVLGVRKELLGIQYNRLNTLEERLAVWQAPQETLAKGVPEEKLQDKKVIFIDDMVTTGATIRAVSEFLSTRYRVKVTHPFLVLSLEKGSASFENRVAA